MQAGLRGGEGAAGEGNAVRLPVGRLCWEWHERVAQRVLTFVIPAPASCPGAGSCRLPPSSAERREEANPVLFLLPLPSGGRKGSA